MIVVDTSVWVEALRDAGSASAEVLRPLLDADEVALALPVRIELMAGVSRANRRALQRALTGLPIVWPTDETWEAVERWTGQAASAGEHFAITDLLIAALADDVGGLVWSLDRDFERMSALKIVRLYE